MSQLGSSYWADQGKTFASAGFTLDVRAGLHEPLLALPDGRLAEAGDGRAGDADVAALRAKVSALSAENAALKEQVALLTAALEDARRAA